MVNKAILVICDGLGDRPIPQLGDLTPLEAARTPNLDQLAAQSECGIMCALGRGVRPGSDVSHLAIMGYDPVAEYPGRGPIEVADLGVELHDGDIALRANMGTVEGPNKVIKDRQAGLKDATGGPPPSIQPLTAALDGIEIDGVKFIVKAGTVYRAGVIMRGEGLSDAITDADPHEGGIPVWPIKPKDNTPQAARTAAVLAKFLDKAHQIMAPHPFNTGRKLPANYLLVRGAGKYRKLQSFADRHGLNACCIAGGGLYRGIGALLGMKVIHVPGATGSFDTDIKAKFRAALDAARQYDFIFVHVKATDTYAEKKNFEGKRQFIEKIDEAAALLTGLSSQTLFVMTADHSTSSELGMHTADPVPIMFRGDGVRVDEVKAFGERACARGGLGFMSGRDVMQHVLNLMGKLHLIGA